MKITKATYTVIESVGFVTKGMTYGDAKAMIARIARNGSTAKMVKVAPVVNQQVALEYVTSGSFAGMMVQAVETRQGGWVLANLYDGGTFVGTQLIAQRCIETRMVDAI